MYKSIRKIILVLTALPLLASSNTDCGGKAFHCVNSTHFMICVDLGGGVSSTIDSFIIPCPPSTVCQETNHFECEFPSPTTSLPVISTSVRSDLGSSDVPYENIIGTLPLDIASATDPTVSTPTLQDQSVTNNDVVTPTIGSTTTLVDYSITAQTIFFGNANSDFVTTQGEIRSTTDAIRVKQLDYTKGFEVTDSTISVLDIVENISQDSSTVEITMTTGNIEPNIDDQTNKPNEVPVDSTTVDMPATTTTIKSYTPQPDITTSNVIPVTESPTRAENNTSMTAFGEATSTGSTLDAVLTDILNASVKVFATDTSLNAATEIIASEQTLTLTNVESNSTDTFNFDLKGTTTGLPTEWEINGTDLKGKPDIKYLFSTDGTAYDTTETNASTLKDTTTDSILVKNNKGLDEFLTTITIAKLTTPVTASDSPTQNLTAVTDAEPQSIIYYDESTILTNAPVTDKQSTTDPNHISLSTSSLGLNNLDSPYSDNLVETTGGNNRSFLQPESIIFSTTGYLDTTTAIPEAVTRIYSGNITENSQIIDGKKDNVTKIDIFGFGNGKVTEETTVAATQASTINNSLLLESNYFNSTKPTITTGSEMYGSTTSVAVSDSTTKNLLIVTYSEPQSTTFYDEITFSTSTPVTVSQSTKGLNYNSIPTTLPGLEDMNESNPVYSEITTVRDSSFPQPESTILSTAGNLDNTLTIVKAVTDIYSEILTANRQVIAVKKKNNVTNIGIFDSKNGHVTEETTMATTEAFDIYNTLLLQNIYFNSTKPTFTNGSEMYESTTSVAVPDSTTQNLTMVTNADYQSSTYKEKTKAPVVVRQSTIELNNNSLPTSAFDLEAMSTSNSVNSEITTVRDNSSSSQLESTNLLAAGNFDNTTAIFEAVTKIYSEKSTKNNQVKNERNNNVKEHITTENANKTAEQDATKQHMLGGIIFSTTILSQDIIIPQTITSDVTEPTLIVANNLSTSNRLNIVEKTLDTTVTSLSKEFIQQANTTQSYHESTGISDLSVTKLLIDKTNTDKLTENIVQQKIVETTDTITLDKAHKIITNDMFLTDKNIRTNNSLQQNDVFIFHNGSFSDGIVTHNSEVLSDTTQITQSSGTEYSTTAVPARNIDHESLNTNIITNLTNNMTIIIHGKSSNYYLNHVNLTSPSTIIEYKTEVHSVTDASPDFLAHTLSVLDDSHLNKASTLPENDPKQSINREKLHLVTHIRLNTTNATDHQNNDTVGIEIQDNHLGISAQLPVTTTSPDSINAKHVEETYNILQTPLGHFEFKNKNKIGIEETTHSEATPIYLSTPKIKKVDNIAAQAQNAKMSPAATQEAMGPPGWPVAETLLFHEVTTNTNFAEITPSQFITPELQVETGITAPSQWKNEVTAEKQTTASTPDLQVKFGSRLKDVVVTETHHANKVKDDFLSEPEKQLKNEVIRRTSTSQPTTHKIQSKDGTVVNALNIEIARPPVRFENNSTFVHITKSLPAKVTPDDQHFILDSYLKESITPTTTTLGSNFKKENITDQVIQSKSELKDGLVTSHNILSQPGTSESQFSSSAAKVQHIETKAAAVMVNGTFKEVSTSKVQHQSITPGQQRILDSTIVRIIKNSKNEEGPVTSINFYGNLGDGYNSEVQQTQNASSYAVTPDGAIKDKIVNITQQNSTETNQVGLYLNNSNVIDTVPQSTSTTSLLNTENNEETQYAVFTQTQLPKVEKGIDNKRASNMQTTETTSPLAKSTNKLENIVTSEIEWQLTMPENQFGYSETTTITSRPLLTPEENNKDETTTVTEFGKIKPTHLTTIPRWKDESVTETQNTMSYFTNAVSSESTIRSTERTFNVNQAQHLNHYLSINSMKRIPQTVKDPIHSYCRRRLRGRYSDPKDCTKFYICIGPYEPIIGKCPANTVFSDFKKQCTKNKSHCMRENEFQCMFEGRFSDILRNNVYYICIRRVNSFVRFKFQCQNGYFLNKTAVKCMKQMESLQQSISIDNTSISKSEISASEKKESKEFKKGKSPIESEKTSDEDFECKKEGKFPFLNNCRQYYECSKNKKSEFRRKRKSCDSDEVFHKDKKECVDEDSYEC